MISSGAAKFYKGCAIKTYISSGRLVDAGITKKISGIHTYKVSSTTISTTPGALQCPCLIPNPKNCYCVRGCCAIGNRYRRCECPRAYCKTERWIRQSKPCCPNILCKSIHCNPNILLDLGYILLNLIRPVAG